MSPYTAGTLALSVAPGLRLDSRIAPAADLLAATGKFSPGELRWACQSLLERGTAEDSGLIPDRLKPFVEALLPCDPAWDQGEWERPFHEVMVS